MMRFNKRLIKLSVLARKMKYSPLLQCELMGMYEGFFLCLEEKIMEI